MKYQFDVGDKVRMIERLEGNRHWMKGVEYTVSRATWDNGKSECIDLEEKPLKSIHRCLSGPGYGWDASCFVLIAKAGQTEKELKLRDELLTVLRENKRLIEI